MINDNRNMITISRVLGLFFICFLLNACNEDNETISDNELLGNWELDKATRDGMETETLSGLFLYFNENSVKTNLSGVDTADLPYAINGSKVILNQSEDMQLDVVSVDKDSLIIQLDIKEIDFRLWFHKM